MTAAELPKLSIAGLAHRCSRETERFYRGLLYDERYCFEIFRRAILSQNERAWSLLVQQYTPQVTAWVERCESFTAVDEARDYFVNQAFARFWRAFNRDPHKIHKFDSLNKLLQYLKLCAYSSVKEHASRHLTPYEVPESEAPDLKDDHDPVATVGAAMRAERLWKHVLSVTKTNQERIIAEAYFVYDMKPMEIYSRYSDHFADVKEVRQVKDNFVRRLRRDMEVLAALESHN